MAPDHEPVIGGWYINLSRQFLKVWGMVYHNGKPQKIVLRYLNGLRLIIELSDWYALALCRYTEKRKPRSGTTLA